MTTAPAALVDIRDLGSCPDRKAHVLALFDALPAGDSLVVVNDHLPNGLRAHLDELRPGAFAWSVLEAGPTVFRVQIQKAR
ncbi:MAG TPA: DUF2249 domain-containing protein [Vicinamibacteria bacterium]|nr:DUF2249 domain-containing protein [Vicinamibacteria bacterium]